METGQTKYYPTIDFFKFIAAFMVVALHTSPLHDTSIEYYFSTICTTAVPFFFASSSFMFFNRGGCLLKYIKRIATMYAIWFVIELPIVYLRYFSDFCFPDSLLYFLKNLLLQNTFYASWFLVASIESMCIVYLLDKFCSKLACFLVCLCFYLVGLFSCMYIGLLAYIPFGDFIKKVLVYFYCDQSFVTAIPFGYVGMYLARNKISISKRAVVFILSLSFVLNMVEAYFCQPARQTISLSIIPIVFCIMYIATSYNIGVGAKTLVFMRKSSILIYLIHCIVIFFIMRYTCIEMGAALFIITSIVSMLASWVIILLSEHILLFKRLY